MGEAELGFEVALGSHQVLHDLHEHAAGIDAQEGAGHDEHFVMQGGKGPEPFVGLALFQRIQQAQYGRGHAQFYGVGKLDDAVGAELGHEARMAAPVLLDRLAYHGEELVVLGVVVGIMRTHRMS